MPASPSRGELRPVRLAPVSAISRVVLCCVVLCCRHDLANCKVLVDFDTNSLATAFLLPLLFSVYSPENRPGRVKRLSPALNVPRTTPCHPQARPLPTPARASACSKMRRSILLISILDGVPYLQSCIVPLPEPLHAVSLGIRCAKFPAASGKPCAKGETAGARAAGRRSAPTGRRRSRRKVV